MSACAHAPSCCIDPVCVARKHCLYAPAEAAQPEAAQAGEPPAFLTYAQRRFLSLHAAHPAPHRWEWLSVNGETAYEHPDTWAKLRAWRDNRSGGQRSAAVTAEQLKVLNAFFDPFPIVNEAGRAMLKRGPR